MEKGLLCQALQRKTPPQQTGSVVIAEHIGAGCSKLDVFERMRVS